MAYSQRNRVLTLLTGLGTDFELITADLVDEAVAEANRIVMHHYAPMGGIQAVVSIPANVFEAAFSPVDDIGEGVHVNEITSVQQVLAGRKLTVPIHAWAEVRWMQNSEGLVIPGANGEIKMCGIRKQDTAAGTHDGGLNWGYDGGFWRIAIYPRVQNTQLLLSVDSQAWDANFDLRVRDSDQKIFMLEEAVRIAAATLAPKAGLKPPQIDTLLSGTPDWALTATEQIHSSLYPWARTVQQARMG